MHRCLWPFSYAKPCMRAAYERPINKQAGWFTPSSLKSVGERYAKLDLVPIKHKWPHAWAVVRDYKC